MCVCVCIGSQARVSTLHVRTPVLVGSIGGWQLEVVLLPVSLVL